jgi:hypothetical protein
VNHTLSFITCRHANHLRKYADYCIGRRRKGQPIVTSDGAGGLSDLQLPIQRCRSYFEFIACNVGRISNIDIAQAVVGDTPDEGNKFVMY